MRTIAGLSSRAPIPRSRNDIRHSEQIPGNADRSNIGGMSNSRRGNPTERRQKMDRTKNASSANKKAVQRIAATRPAATKPNIILDFQTRFDVCSGVSIMRCRFVVPVKDSPSSELRSLVCGNPNPCESFRSRRPKLLHCNSVPSVLDGARNGAHSRKAPVLGRRCSTSRRLQTIDLKRRNSWLPGPDSNQRPTG
jgi:hypothetical protein